MVDKMKAEYATSSTKENISKLAIKLNLAKCILICLDYFLFDFYKSNENYLYRHLSQLLFLSDAEESLCRQKVY